MPHQEEKDNINEAIHLVGRIIELGTEYIFALYKNFAFIIIKFDSSWQAETFKVCYKLT